MIKPLVKRADTISDRLIDVLRASMLLAPFVFFQTGTARAAEATTVYETVEEEIEYIEVPDGEEGLAEADADRTLPSSIASFGPFQVISPDKAIVTGGIDASGPRNFSAMMARYPGIRTLELVDCPGSLDDDANMALGRIIRRAGIATHVPAGGSIRSGGVDLFLAGTTRSADPRSEFGVHSWADDEGNDARSIPASDPVHQRYLSYYREMGMSPEAARAFYDFTNRAAPPEGLHLMTPGERARYGLIAVSAFQPI